MVVGFFALFELNLTRVYAKSMPPYSPVSKKLRRLSVSLATPLILMI